MHDYFKQRYDEDYIDGEEEDFENTPGNISITGKLSSDFKSDPIHGLGVEAQEYLTPQQLNIVISMWRLLRSGNVQILKHGRHGRPKLRTLFCNKWLSMLYWREPGTSIDIELDEDVSCLNNCVQNSGGDRTQYKCKPYTT